MLVALLIVLAVKEGKKMAKIILAEGKAEKKALDDALKELADMQRMQKTAVKVRLPTPVAVLCA